jgi:hypothetical protein
MHIRLLRELLDELFQAPTGLQLKGTIFQSIQC